MTQKLKKGRRLGAKNVSGCDDAPMNDSMVKLILQSAGFNSVDEVRKIAKEENEKALQAAFEQPVDFDKPDWIKSDERK
tara:strand:- start:3303 stop:3539 length:237 start_codon:yes stop_codon:yes gene_type:complete